MATTYAETPDNFPEIESRVITDIREIKNIFFQAEKVFFYDACSFQRHSNLKKPEKNIIIRYFRKSGTAVFITRCILMELCGEQHILTQPCIGFFVELNEAGVKVVLYNEECTYDFLSECFSTNERINEYLMWAVRTVKTPVSTITETLKADEKMNAEVCEGKYLKVSDLYRRFFSAVRGNKEHQDDLGEELISICVQILLQLPGVTDGKLCVLTDDKGAAGRIHSAVRRTCSARPGAKVILFSTPKLVQHMFEEHAEISEEEMVNILSQGISDNIVIMGITAYDLEVNKKMSISCRALAKKIIEPNGVRIVF